jgi:hypothetical protein
MAVFWLVAPTDDGGSKDLGNVGKLLPDYTTLQRRRQPSSYSPPWEPQILRRLSCLGVWCKWSTHRTFWHHIKVLNASLSCKHFLIIPLFHSSWLIYVFLRIISCSWNEIPKIRHWIDPHRLRVYRDMELFKTRMIWMRK